jgi:hypothetical protein
VGSWAILGEGGIRMAERRMFTMKVVDSDAFLDMPMSTQALYFHLNMRADDDGFVNNPKKILRMVGASEDDLRLLIAKRFILCFENGVIVIKHWRMHNLLRKDRYNPTQYIEEKAMLTIKGDGAYTETPNDNQPATTRQPNDNQLATQDSIGEVSEVEDSIVEVIEPPKKETRHKYGAYNNVLLSDSDLEKLKAEFPDYKERIERLSEYIASTGKSYKNHLATIRSWAKKDKATKSYGRTAAEKNAGYCFNQNEDSLDDLF